MTIFHQHQAVHSNHDTNIGNAHHLGSVGMSKATQFISDLSDDGIKPPYTFAGDQWSDNVEWNMWPWDYSQLGDKNQASCSLSLWS